MDALAGEDLVEGTSELGVAITQQEADRNLSVLELPGQIASLLEHPFADRMRAHAGEVDSTAADLDEEEDVEASQPYGLDCEEVGGQEGVGVLVDEVCPGAPTASGRGRDAAPAEDLGDAHVGDLEAELEQLALDSPVTPARVLTGEPKNELAQLGIPPPPAGWSAEVGCPIRADQFAVPA